MKWVTIIAMSGAVVCGIAALIVWHDQRQQAGMRHAIAQGVLDAKAQAEREDAERAAELERQEIDREKTKMADEARRREIRSHPFTAEPQRQGDHLVALLDRHSARIGSAEPSGRVAEVEHVLGQHPRRAAEPANRSGQHRGELHLHVPRSTFHSHDLAPHLPALRDRRLPPRPAGDRPGRLLAPPAAAAAGRGVFASPGVDAAVGQLPQHIQAIASKQSNGILAHFHSFCHVPRSTFEKTQ